MARAVGYARSSSTCLNAYAYTASNLQPGVQGTPILTPDEISPCALAWGPTASVADQVIFLAFPNLGQNGATLYRATEGNTASNSTRLFSVGIDALLLSFGWAVDGESVIFARTTEYINPDFVESNLFEYIFATGKITQLTNLDNELVRSFTLSPDGQTIVFERAATLGSTTSDLWIMNRNGSDLRLLVENGRIPTWRPSASQTPAATATPTYTPTPLPTGAIQIFLPTVQQSIGRGQR